MTKAFYLKNVVYGSLRGYLGAFIYYSGFNQGHSVGIATCVYKWSNLHLSPVFNPQ